MAAAYLGLPCHLILRNSRVGAGADPGLVGNLLVERLVGATVHQVGGVGVKQGGRVRGVTLVGVTRQLPCVHNYCSS